MTLIFKHVAAAALTCAAMLAPLTASAVPAYPGPIKMTQPDGTEITVLLRGDEHHHITLSEDGYLLTNRDNTYYYADVDQNGNIVSSSYMAKPVAKRTAAERNFLSGVNMERAFSILSSQREAVMAAKDLTNKLSMPATRSLKSDDDYKGYGLMSYSTYPVKGKQKGLVILVEYQDVKFNNSYDPHDYFSRMVNEEGFSTNGGTGSARDFFLECSDGQFDIEFDVYGPVTLPHERAYYGGNAGQSSTGGDDIRPWEMTIHACQLLEDEVDFTQYDRDNDGKIDNVFVFYAGQGEASGGPVESVWPHAFYVSTKGNYKVDGVQIDRYACTNEWETLYRTPRPDGVGTFIHEFSHVMGLPDLYATSYSSAFTPGSWSCMDLGSYNNEGRTPPLHGIFERNAFGWMKPTEITGALNGRLESIGSNQGYIINTSRPQEFFLLENRQQTSWDRYIPGNGMLIWHILYNSNIWSQNTCNNNALLQYIDIEEADGLLTEATRNNDAFPGVDGQFTSFTDETTPGMLTWNKLPLNLPITDIALSNGVITFKVAGGKSEVASTEALESKDITGGGFTAVWKASSVKDATYALTVYTKDKSGKAVYTPELFNKSVSGTSYTTNDLDPLTTYYWTITVYDPESDAYSDPSNELTFTTLEGGAEQIRPVLAATTGITSESFTINWLPVEGATEYYINFFSKAPVAPKSVTTGLNNYISPTFYLDEGWTSNVRANYTNEKYCGESVPAMKMQVDGMYIQTPVLKGSNTIRSLSFWHRGITSNTSNTIIIEGLVGEDWVRVAELPISYASSGETLTVNHFPPMVQSARIRFSRLVNGSLSLDDITYTYATDDTVTPIAGMDEVTVAAPATSLNMDNVKPGIYYFNVTALKDGVRTRTSRDLSIEIIKDAAIGSVGADTAADVTINGNTLTAGENAEVYDTTGRLVATVAAGRSITLAQGIYLVHTATASTKVAVK